MVMGKNADPGVICIVFECLRRPGMSGTASTAFCSGLCMSRDINKERDFHRFGFKFAGVKCRLVNQVRPFTQNP
jgi:hypothetical protein